MAGPSRLDTAQSHLADAKLSPQQRVDISAVDNDVAPGLIQLKRCQSALNQFLVRRFDCFAFDERHVAYDLAHGSRIGALTGGVPVPFQTTT